MLLNCYSSVYVCICSCRSLSGINSRAMSVASLLCGGYDINSTSLLLSSVYQSAGPVLYNLTVTASHTAVFTGQLLELVATTYSQASLTTPLGELLLFQVSKVSK